MGAPAPGVVSSSSSGPARPRARQPSTRHRSCTSASRRSRPGAPVRAGRGGRDRPLQVGPRTRPRRGPGGAAEARGARGRGLAAAQGPGGSGGDRRRRRQRERGGGRQRLARRRRQLCQTSDFPSPAAAERPRGREGKSTKCWSRAEKIQNESTQPRLGSEAPPWRPGQCAGAALRERAAPPL